MKQQQKQIVVLQILLVGRSKRDKRRSSDSRLNTGSNRNMAKPLIFNKKVNKILEFLMVCKLYIKIKMRDASVEE